MMISPEGYYEMNLKGKSQQEIMTEIRSLKREIGRLKRKLEEHCFDQKVTMYPNPLTRISCSRDYLERAKQAYEEAGGIYQLTKAELRDKAFNDGLLFMKRFVFDIGGFFDGYDKRTYTISGEKVLFDLEHSFYLKPSNLPVCEAFTKDEFVSGITGLHIGEWKKKYVNPLVLDGTQWGVDIEYADGRKPVHIYGSNAFPYNFDNLLEFLGIDEEDDTDEQDQD